MNINNTCKSLAKKWYTKASALFVIGVSTVQAAIPASVDTAVTDMTTDGLAMADKMWPYVVAVFGATVLFKLFKRFGNKA